MGVEKKRGEVSISTENNDMLQKLLQEESSLFLGIIKSYVVRMKLAIGDSAQSVAQMILQETTIEALAHPERFATASQPRAWILAVAANILKRKRRELARQTRYEIPVSGLLASREDLQENAFFEQITSLAVPGPEQEIEAQEQVREMLALVSLEDQQVLRLAILLDMDGQMLAATLAVPPSTARSRLHRALARLRIAWTRHEQQRMEN